MSSSNDDSISQSWVTVIRELVAKGEVPEDVLHDSDATIRWWRSLDTTKQNEIISKVKELSQGQEVRATGNEKQEHQAKSEVEKVNMNWLQRHLNWTWLFAYLIWIPLNASRDVEPQIIGSIFLLVASGWVIKQKGRSLWWILLTPFFSPLWLSNKKKKIASSQEPIKTPLIQRAKTGTGYFVQVIGWLLWLGCGLAICIRTFGIIADALGEWVAIIAFIFFPVLFTFAPLIHWLITGIVPLHIFILWLVTLVAIVIVYLGSRIKGEEL